MSEPIQVINAKLIKAYCKANGIGYFINDRGVEISDIEVSNDTVMFTETMYDIPAEHEIPLVNIECWAAIQ